MNTGVRYHPEKERLSNNNDYTEKEDDVMSAYDLVIPLGIASFILAAITVVLGLWKSLLPAKIRLRVHKICGFTLLAVAAVHGAIVFYYNFIAV